VSGNNPIYSALEIVFGLHIEPLIGLLAVLGLLATGMGASLIIKEKTND